MHLIAAAITAGGRSSRFAAQSPASPDKALAQWQGRSLLQHVAAGLNPPLSDVPGGLRLLIAPGGRYTLNQFPELAGWQQVPDTRPGEGPLAGLEAALQATTSTVGEGWLAFAGVDMPTLDAGYWQTLAGAVAPDALSVQASDPSGQVQPLAALYHTALLPRVSALLDAGERRLRLACPPEQIQVVPGLPAVYFQNINRPADLAALPLSE